MQALYVLGFLLTAFSTGWAVYLFSKRQHLGQVQALESKIRTSESETSHLKEQVGSLKGEVVALQKTLSEERVSKQEALTALSDSLRGALVSVGIMAFIMGGAMAGGMSWMAATWRAEAKMLTKNTDQTIQYELTKLKLELLEKQFEKSEQERMTFQASLQQEQILRTVAETRLEALMGGLAMPQSLQGLPLDYPKFQNGANQSVKKNVSPEDLSLLKQVPFKP